MSNNQDNTRPEFPKRAVITAGMPYGNKNLHFGHVGGVFVPADCFARFMRDRIGADNVQIVSGTDCYGSPIDEGYRKLVESGEFDGTIADYVMRNHKAQAEALANYDISLDVFEGSGIGKSAAIHNEMTAEVIRKLHDGGFLELDETKQFYDETAGTFLNGRQVVGRCPVQGCKSERAWADECELGHQYSPEELIAPKSTISGEAPSMRPVYNWYFKLPEFSDKLRDYISMIANDGITRQVVSQTIDEFLVPPIIYVKQEFQEQYDALAAQMPAHTYRPVPKGKASFELEFADLAARDAAREILSKAGVRFRTGKALVPLRITGNIDWGVPAPSLTDNTSGKQTDGLTVWCWPESLWAPISFTKRLQGDSWRDYWTGADARAYQFIGQDNIYF
ncbi:MAG: class I tRNA ligase family protein, partial [Coriobacteriales bacterium]|nr:class I tRNA ligase family protein [Coriobacteriales bacterium]